MKAIYNNLWKLLEIKNISLKELKHKTKISSATLTKMNNNEFISNHIIEKICGFLDCEPSDVIVLEDEIAKKNPVSSHHSNMRVISLFSGAGGMDLGFKQEGFEIVWANDIISEAVETYEINIGKHITKGDIRFIPSESIPDDIDVVIGGFPCQGFSVANNKRGMHDKRNFLYKEMLRIIGEKKPKIFVAENVKGLLSIEKGEVIKMIKNDFEKLGYFVEYKLINAAEYGVPQLRERVFIIGNRLEKRISFPLPTHTLDTDGVKNNLKPAITCEETIGFLKNVECSRDTIKLPDGRNVYQHFANENVAKTFWTRKYKVDQSQLCDYLNKWRMKKGLTTKQIDEFFGYKYTAGHWFRKDNKSGSIPKVTDWWKLKDLLGFDNKFDKKVTTMIEKEMVFEQALRVTNWDRPSDTITATSPEIHINKLRRLSVRECALIQTFPHNFIFAGKTFGSMYKQIGNAVPVLLARKIAIEVRKMLKSST